MILSFKEFAANLAGVDEQIAAACAAAGRDVGSVRLLPVTKNHPVEAARYAWEAGLRAVGRMVKPD